jgi:hypothetical protein
MRAKTKDDFDCILDCMTGADGGVSFVMLQNFLNALDAQAESGDAKAEEIVNIMRRFAKMIRYAESQQP